MGARPPSETFTRPTCRGSKALGTSCGHCEKCLWEQSQASAGAPPPDSMPDEMTATYCTIGETEPRQRVRVIRTPDTCRLVTIVGDQIHDITLSDQHRRAIAAALHD